MSAVAVAKDVFAARNIGTDQLPAVSPQPLALNEVAERVDRPAAAVLLDLLVDTGLSASAVIASSPTRINHRRSWKVSVPSPCDLRKRMGLESRT